MSEYYSALNRNGLSSHEQNGRNLNEYYYAKEVNLKRLLLYDINSMTFWERQNYGDSERICGYQGLAVKVL